MLYRVSEYVDKNNIPYRIGCAYLDARFIIACDQKENYLGVEGYKRGEEREFACAPFLEQPDMISGGITKSQFLLDTAAAVVLYDGKSQAENEVPEKESDNSGENGKIPERHRYFWRLIAEASKAVIELEPLTKLNSPDVLARVRKTLKEKGATTTDRVSFRIGCEYPAECDYWYDWWEKKLAEIQALKSNNSKQKTRNTPMLSLLSCKTVLPCLTHPKLKKLPETQQSGATLISFERSSPAFSSYGLEQSQNCAMSDGEAAKYVAGLNYLIRKSSRDLCGARVIYWYKEPVAAENDAIASLYANDDGNNNNRLAALDDLPADDPATEAAALRRMRELLDAIRSGQHPDLAGNEFYILTMAGNRGRAVVRDWQEGRYEKLLEAVAAWQSDTQICLPNGRLSPRAPGIQRLIECVLPPPKHGQKREERLKRVQSIRAVLWHAAIGNCELPGSLISRLVPELRNFALTGALEECCFPSKKQNARKSSHEKKAPSFNFELLLWQRMALLKAYHIREGAYTNHGSDQERNNSMTIKPCLNPDHPSPAYHCGRLMALIADVQHKALEKKGRKINSGVIQRYYAAASATPGLVFGALIRNTQFYLAKLRKEKPWLAEYFNREAAKICCSIGQQKIPATLSLEEQSLFALGFYQQIAQHGSTNSGINDGSEKPSIPTGIEEVAQ
jgi:CRISPR-associated protein Csd1